jgi:DNA (cytosine-5)-methyltransferase 1
MLTHGGAFAGYGGTHMAAAAVLGPLTTRWVADTKPAAVALLHHRYPDVPNLGDVRFTHYGRHEPVDIRTDSWPCQPHSAAGLRRGEDDPRALWPVVAANLAAARPALWLGENVGRCTGTGELRRVVRALAALGYVGAWRTQRADHLGACHRRDRLFVVAVDPDHPRLPAVADAVRDAPARPVADRPHSLTLLPTPAARDHKGVMPRGDRADGYARTRAQLCLPGAVALLPTPTARNGCGPDFRGARPAGGGPDLQTAVQLLPTPRASDGPHGGPNMRGSSGDWSLPGAVQPDRFGVYAPAVARHAALLGRPAPEPTMTGRNGSSQLNPWFVEWMMCLPHGWVCAAPTLGERSPASWRSRALSLLGDGVVPAQGAAAFAPMLRGVLADLDNPANPRTA